MSEPSSWPRLKRSRFARDVTRKAALATAMAIIATSCAGVDDQDDIAASPISVASNEHVTSAAAEPTEQTAATLPAEAASTPTAAPADLPEQSLAPSVLLRPLEEAIGALAEAGLNALATPHNGADIEPQFTDIVIAQTAPSPGGYVGLYTESAIDVANGMVASSKFPTDSFVARTVRIDRNQVNAYVVMPNIGDVDEAVTTCAFALRYSVRLEIDDPESYCWVYGNVEDYTASEVSEIGEFARFCAVGQGGLGVGEDESSNVELPSVGFREAEGCPPDVPAVTEPPLSNDPLGVAVPTRVHGAPRPSGAAYMEGADGASGPSDARVAVVSVTATFDETVHWYDKAMPAGEPFWFWQPCTTNAPLVADVNVRVWRLDRHVLAVTVATQDDGTTAIIIASFGPCMELL